MTSASTGWALYYPENPADPSANPHMLLARTADGARTWANVTPAAARPLLSTSNAAEVLDAVDGERTYLAVTGSTQESAAAVNLTVVFTTNNGGRTWTESAPLRTAATISLLSFADAEHGWLLMSAGAAAGHNAVRVYRTADGGRHWSLTAASPPLTAATPPLGSSSTGTGIPLGCDKAGLAFASATTGWLSSTCAVGLQGELLVSRDGGTTWATQSLPLPASTCDSNQCFVIGPQFTGGTGFLTVAPEAGTPSLLTSRDLGQTWTPLSLPAGAGRYPQIKFFSPSLGLLVSAGAQEALGDVFYTTSDGGQTWSPVTQGVHFTQLGASVDFVSPRAGFAWILGSDQQGAPPPLMYQTADSGRTWESFTPRLDG
jgi:photosystem II stability/assembly factor-like uncharacterized protein